MPTHRCCAAFPTPCMHAYKLVSPGEKVGDIYLVGKVWSPSGNTINHSQSWPDRDQAPTKNTIDSRLDRIGTIRCDNTKDPQVQGCWAAADGKCIRQPGARSQEPGARAVRRREGTAPTRRWNLGSAGNDATKHPPPGARFLPLRIIRTRERERKNNK